MPNQDMHNWLAQIGIKPELLALATGGAGAPGAGAAPGAAAAPDPWAGPPKAALSGAAPAASGELPQPMLPDCKVVHGKVPGPKNHVLCAKHGHVVDTDAKMIIAHDVNDYKKRQLVSKVAGAAAPLVQGVAKLAGAVPILGAAAPEPPPQEPKLPPEERAYRLNVGKTLVATKGLGFVTASCTELVNDLIKWKAGWEQKIKELSGEATESGGIFAKLFGIVAGAVCVIAPELGIVKEAAEKIEALEKAADITEVVADRVDEESKKSAEKVKQSALDQLQKLCDAVSDEVNRMLKSGEAAIKQQLDGLDKDPAVAVALINAEDSGIAFVIEQKLKIKNPDHAHREIAKSINKLDVEMDKFLKDAVVEEKTAWVDKMPGPVFGGVPKEIMDEQKKRMKEDAVKEAKEDYDQAEFAYDVKHGNITVQQAKK